MNCPYCGEDMEKGVIQSQHELSWQRKRHLFGGAEVHKGSVLLSESSFLKGSAAIAYCCRKCEKIIIDYKDGACDANK